MDIGLHRGYFFFGPRPNTRDQDKGNQGLGCLAAASDVTTTIPTTLH